MYREVAQKRECSTFFPSHKISASVQLNPYDTMINYFQHDLLTPYQCLDIVNNIYQLQDYWLYHGGDLHSLGYPLYQAGSLNNSYSDYANKYNIMMYIKFRWLYELITEFLENYLGQRVYFQNGLSIPGFHIFKFTDSYRFDGGSLHFDLSHQLAFQSASNKNADNISIILPLKLPLSPCGLDVWSFTYEDMDRGLSSEYLQKITTKGFISYSVGQISLIHGLYWHRISPIDKCYINEERITLQVHCSRINNNWILFW